MVEIEAGCMVDMISRQIIPAITKVESKPDTSNLTTETRNTKPETPDTKHQKPNEKPEPPHPKHTTRNTNSKTRIPKPENRSPKPDNCNPKIEIRSSKPEPRTPKAGGHGFEGARSDLRGRGGWVKPTPNAPNSKPQAPSASSE